MQFQVPQFIETEDKIVGPFTLRQFIYVAVAGAFSFFLYFTVQTWLWVTISFFALGGALAFAFVKVEGRDLPHVAVSAFGFYWKPQTYVWQPERPEVQKNESSMQSVAGDEISLESIVSGIALKNAWRKLQTGTKISGRDFAKKIGDKYQIFQRLSGAREAARRVDYR